MKNSSKCLVVMYHYVRDRAGGEDAEIRGLSPRAFQAQLDVLCEQMHPIDWPTFASWQEGSREIEDPSVLLTFDDGLADHAEVVCPILDRRGLRAAFFVSTGLLSGGTLDVAHQIHLLLCRRDGGELLRAARAWLWEHAGPARFEDTPSDRKGKKVYGYESAERAELKYFLNWVLPLDLRERLVTALFREHVGDPASFAARWYLNWDQVDRMQRSGHTLGGHGHAHRPYGRLDPTEQSSDLERCATLLREKLGDRPRPFSYPFGSHDDRIAGCCARAGFVQAFTTEPRWVSTTEGAHRLGRVDTIAVDSFLEKEFSCPPR